MSRKGHKAESTQKKGWLEKNLRKVPVILAFIVVVLVMVSIAVSTTPLYRYAVERETGQVTEARTGVKNFIDTLLGRAELLTWSASQDPTVTAPLKEALTGGSMRTLRGRLMQLQSFSKAHFIEVIKPDGEVFSSVPFQERVGAKVADWHVFRDTHDDNLLRTLMTVQGHVFATASIALFHEGERQGTLVLGFEIDAAEVKSWSEKLTSGVSLKLADGKDLISSLENQGKPFFVSTQSESPEVLQAGKSRYAAVALPLKANDNSVVAVATLVKPLDGFFQELQSMFWKAGALLIPLLIACLSLLFYMGRSVVKLSAEIARHLSELTVSYEKLQTKELALQERIGDAVSVQKISDQVAASRTTALLSEVVLSNSKPLLPHHELILELDLSARVADLPTRTPVQWNREFVSSSSSAIIGRFAALGARALTERERTLLETLYATTRLGLDNISYVAESVMKSQMESEIRIARQVQAAIMPQSWPSGDCFSVSGFFTSATTLGGDWMGCFYDEATQVFRAYIGDVTGHGIPSAIVATAAMSHVHAIEAEVKGLRPNIAFNMALNRLNSIVWIVGNQKFLMTFQIVEIECRTGRVRVANAGHNLPLYQHGLDKDIGEKARTMTPKELKNHVKQIVGNGQRLGFSSSYEKCFRTSTFQMIHGQRFVVYTDGLTEAKNPRMEEYGVTRLSRCLVENSSLDAQSLSLAVETDFKAFTEGRPLDDDVTFLVFDAREGFAAHPEEWEQGGAQIEAHEAAEERGKVA